MATNPRLLGERVDGTGLQSHICLTGRQLLTVSGLSLALPVRQQLKHRHAPGATTIPRRRWVVLTLLVLFSYDTIAVPGVSLFLKTLL